MKSALKPEKWEAPINRALKIFANWSNCLRGITGRERGMVLVVGRGTAVRTGGVGAGVLPMLGNPEQSPAAATCSACPHFCS